MEGSRDQPDHHAHQRPAAIPAPLVAPPRGTGTALSLALTAAAASGLAATPAWAAGGYHIIATIAVGGDPSGVAVSPRGTRAYVTNSSSPGSVSVINTATNQVTATIGGLRGPVGVAVSPDGTRAYVPHRLQSVSVIDTGTCHRHHRRPR